MCSPGKYGPYQYNANWRAPDTMLAFLLSKYMYLTTQFNQGVQQVHVIFDSPALLKNTPNCFEHNRRDSIASTNSEHYCDEFNLT